jgi:hypothetical protein
MPKVIDDLVYVEWKQNRAIPRLHLSGSIEQPGVDFRTHLAGARAAKTDRIESKAEKAFRLLERSGHAKVRNHPLTPKMVQD